MKTTMKLAAILLATLPAGKAWGDDQPIVFNRDIRPILSENCIQCHGPDAKVRKGKLRLDREGALKARKGHVAAIVPNKSGASGLVAHHHGRPGRDHAAAGNRQKADAAPDCAA